MVLDGSIDITVAVGFVGGIGSKLVYDVIAHRLEQRRKAKRETKQWYDDMMKYAKEAHIDARMYKSNIRYFTLFDPDEQEYVYGPKPTEERIEWIKQKHGWEDKEVSGLHETFEEFTHHLRLESVGDIREEIQTSMELHVSRLREQLSTQPDDLDDEIVETASTLLEKVNKMKILKNVPDSNYNAVKEASVELVQQCDEAINELE
ncbi:hypothetical protein [Natronosalvus caseinilyticus]|uniref:hypothetical protein n=1 Tax=Natronosalvus caseinilyticus TaxID=2953747 RepID=UPI0028AB22F5|nr:hypothetical protein [Natronosalvus caseinilyticus]